jgi:type I restriction enzyme S subunit
MEWNKIRLTEICKPKQWKNLPSNKLLENGYPVYGANGVIGFYSEYNHELPTLAITCRGSTCGNIHLTP